MTKLVPVELKRSLLVILRVVRAVLQAPLVAPFRVVRFIRDLRTFRRCGGRASIRHVYPMLGDRGAHPVDTHYVTQIHWATARILRDGPREHVDVGSQSQFVASMAAHLPVTFIDLRPFELELPGLSRKMGSVTELPFADGSVKSLSSLHVIEHIGLGRYGDELDPFGTERAAQELTRVLSGNGRLYVSLPIGTQRVEFNAHRVHDVPSVLELFAGLEMISLSVVDDEGAVWWDVDPGDERWSSLRYGCGMFEFSR